MQEYGINGYSRLNTADIKALKKANDKPFYTHNRFYRLSIAAIVYYIIVWIYKSRYPHYSHYRGMTAWQEAIAWLKAPWRKLRGYLPDKRLQNKLTKEQSNNFYQLIQQFRTDPQKLFSMTKDDFNKYMDNNTTNIGSYYFNMLDGKLEGIDQKYDYIIFDTPPEMKAITSSVLSVVDSAIIPFEPDAYTVDGLINILSRIKAITTDYNPKLKIAGVLAEKVRKNVKIHSEVELAVAKYCMANNINYLQSEIPNSIRFASATGYKGLPATLVEEDDKFVKNYFKLYDELKKDKSL